MSPRINSIPDENNGWPLIRFKQWPQIEPQLQHYIALSLRLNFYPDDP